MKAEEILWEFGVKHDNTWDGWYYSEDSVIEAMKEYARAVAKDTLERAAINVGIEIVCLDNNCSNCPTGVCLPVVVPDRDGIRDTPIMLP